MLSKEEIENIKEDLKNLYKMLGKRPSISTNAIKNALNYMKYLEARKQKLIEKLKEKDKIIDLMAEELDASDYCVPGDCPGIDCKEHVKEYYRKMAKEGNNE